MGLFDCDRSFENNAYSVLQMVITMEVRAVRSTSVPNTNKASFANHVLILNLALADFLMGVYLLGLCSMDAQLSGAYCIKSEEWLHGFTCKAMGALVSLSSQASVLTLVLLTSVRVSTLTDVSSRA